MTIFLVKIQFLRTFCEELFFMIYFYDFEQFELGCLFSTEICRGDIENIKNERVNVEFAHLGTCYKKQFVLRVVVFGTC